MSNATKEPALWILVVLGLTTFVIIAAVVLALPLWLWTFAVGVGAGVMGERRWSQHRGGG